MISVVKRIMVLGFSLAALVGTRAPASADWFRPFDDRGFFEDRATAAPKVHKRHKSKIKAEKAKTESLPTGPLQIVVSIARQRAYLYSSTVRIGEASISTGVAGHPTPMGVFSVIAKSRYHSSNIYSGAPMPYMQRITWSGIALHQGPLPGFPASHGCIRLPEAFAVKLWRLSKIGTRVIVTRDEVAPVAVESPRLFEPKAPEPAVDTPKQPGTTASVGELAAAPLEQAVAAKPPAQKPKPPVQVFVSRKAGKLYVRQGFEALFDAPVTIAEPDKPWGTHVFTVAAIKDNKARWIVLTIPSGYAREPAKHGRKISARERERLEKRAADLANAPAATEALARFDMPPDAVDRVSQMLAVGSALIVSDNALSDETGAETGFIVMTR